MAVYTYMSVCVLCKLSGVNKSWFVFYQFLLYVRSGIQYADSSKILMDGLVELWQDDSYDLLVQRGKGCEERGLERSANGIRKAEKGWREIHGNNSFFK